MRSAWPRSRNTHQDGHFASRAAPDGKGELNADSGVVVLCNQDPSHRGSTSGCPHPRVPRGPGWGGLRAPVGRTEGPRPLPRGRGPSSRSRRVNPPCFTRFVGLGRGWHDGVAAHRSSAWPPPILGKSLTPSSGDESPASWRLPSRREGGWRVVPVPRTGPVPHPPRRRSQGPPKASTHVAEGRGRRVRHRRCSRSRKPTPDTKIAENASSVYPRSNMRGTVLQRRFRTGPCPSRRAGQSSYPPVRGLRDLQTSHGDRPSQRKGPRPYRYERRPDLHLSGGAEGIRTPDLLIANETRYQLRHSPSASQGDAVGNVSTRSAGPPNRSRTVRIRRPGGPSPRRGGCARPGPRRARRGRSPRPRPCDRRSRRRCRRGRSCARCGGWPRAW